MTKEHCKLQLPNISDVSNLEIHKGTLGPDVIDITKLYH